MSAKYTCGGDIPNTPASAGIATLAAHIPYGAGAPASAPTRCGCATQNCPLGHMPIVKCGWGTCGVPLTLDGGGGEGGTLAVDAAAAAAAGLALALALSLGIGSTSGPAVDALCFAHAAAASPIAARYRPRILAIMPRAYRACSPHASRKISATAS